MNIFDKSLFMKPGAVLGYQLKPFSAHHASCLIMLDSPFLHGKGDPAWGDIVAIIMICSGDSKSSMDRYLSFLNSPVYRLLWQIRLFFCNLNKVKKQLNNHVAAYFDYPEVGIPQSEGGSSNRKSGAPWPYFCISLLWQSTSSNLYELWNMPLSELLCHKAIYDEMNGIAEIMDGIFEERERNKQRAQKKKAA